MSASAITSTSNPDPRLHHRLFFKGKSEGIAATGIGPGSLIANNTIYNSDLDGINTENDAQVAVRNNIIYDVPTPLQLGSNTTASNNLTSDPRFVNAGGGDFHLQAGSPAIDAGMVLPDVPSDFDGNKRPAGAAYDMGAYEFVDRPDSGRYTLVASPSTVEAGGHLLVSWTASPQNSTKDWIGLYVVSETDNRKFVPDAWQYTGGRTSGSFTLRAPATPGMYEFRYLLDDGFRDVQRSEAIRVTASTGENPAPPGNLRIIQP